MRLEKNSQPPYSVSSDFGQLAVSRHLISGMDWATAGAATADAATPKLAAFKNSRRFMTFPLLPVFCRRKKGQSKRTATFFSRRQCGQLYANVDRCGMVLSSRSRSAI